MTPVIATYLIPRDMREKGYAEEDYITDHMDYVVKGRSTLTINGDNEYFYLISSAVGLTITSDFGVYDLKNTRINRLQHKYQGRVTIKNYTKKTIRIEFMQVIVKQK
jgi:hypothetical protein